MCTFHYSANVPLESIENVLKFAHIVLFRNPALQCQRVCHRPQHSTYVQFIWFGFTKHCVDFMKKTLFMAT